jgi:hypothetical protein
VGLVLAFAGHGVATGQSPQVAPGVLLAAVLVLVGCVVASSRAWTLGRLVVALVGVQFAVHVALALSEVAGPVDPRLAGIASSAPTHTSTHAHAGSVAASPTMLAAHAVAVVLAALALARIDHVVVVLWSLARHLFSPVTASLVVPVGPRTAARADAGPVLASRSVLVAPVRGPPGRLALS